MPHPAQPLVNQVVLEQITRWTSVLHCATMWDNTCQRHVENIVAQQAGLASEGSLQGQTMGAACHCTEASACVQHGASCQSNMKTNMHVCAGAVTLPLQCKAMA